MQPLDLERERPRGPRVKVAGIIFTARIIDKLRAALPGGKLNGFFPFTGFSEAWQKYSGIDLRELYGVVRDASIEDQVVAWIEERTAHLDKDAVNAKLETFVTSRLPEAWRPTFEAVYPKELRDRHAKILDLLEADDERIYGITPQPRSGS
jgi:hypothetical protein